jgi:transposase-like protein
VTGSEIITRRRKWKPAEKAGLLAEVEAEGGKVVVVARMHDDIHLLINIGSPAESVGD